MPLSPIIFSTFINLENLEPLIRRYPQAYFNIITHKDFISIQSVKGMLYVLQPIQNLFNHLSIHKFSWTFWIHCHTYQGYILECLDVLPKAHIIYSQLPNSFVKYAKQRGGILKTYPQLLLASNL